MIGGIPLIADLHNDFLTSETYKQTIRSYKKSGNYIVCAIFKGKRTFSNALSLARFFNKNKNETLFLSYEDFSYNEDFSSLEKLLDYDPVYVTLTWIGASVLGAGAGADGGLTPRGREVVRLLNERKIAVDTAHLNKRSFFEVADIADKVVCSHVAFSALNEHKRNIDYEQLKVLFERKALVGLCFYSEFLTRGKATELDLLAHIDYFAQRFGVDTLCVGTDFFGCNDLPAGYFDYSFELRLKNLLLNNGYDSEAADKILYKNALSLLYNNMA